MFVREYVRRKGMSELGGLEGEKWSIKWCHVAKQKG